jgi:hypothetical protein
MVRSSISLLTHLGPSEGPPTVVASVLSVNGSARTAKLAAMAHIRKCFRLKLKDMEGKELQRACGKLEETLSSIQNID